MARNRIAGITIEIDGNTTKLQNALKEVNTSLKKTDTALRDVNKLLKLDPGNTNLLKQKQELLTKAIGDTKSKLEQEKQALEQLKANNDTGEVTEAQKNLEREIEATTLELKDLEQEYKEFGSVGSQQLKAIGEKLQDTGKKMQEVGKNLTQYVTVPIVGIGTAAVKTAADFDSQMTKVGSISGATGKDLDTLRNKAKEMGEKTKFSAKEAGEAMEYMGMAGWDAGQMVDGLEGIMNLAAASGEDLGTTSDIVTDALSAFGLEAKESAHFADILAAASTSANTNVSMMGETFKYAAPVAGSLGYSAEDTAIAIGLMANSGIKASQAGTALRTGMTNLVKPTKQMQAAMDKYGISITDSNGNMLSMRDLTKELRQKLGGLDESEQAAAAAAIFGKNAMSGWLAIINATDEDVDKLTKSIDECDGTSETMAKTMNDTLSGQLTILKSQLEGAAISIGEALIPSVRDVVSIFQDWVDKFNQLSPQQKDMIIKFGLLAAAIGPVVTVAGTLVTGIGSVVSAFGSVTGAITAAGGLVPALGGLATAAAPFLIGGAVVVGIVAAAALIIKNWDKIKEAGKKLVENIGKGWNTLKENTSKAWNTMTSNIKTKFNDAKSAISTTASNIASDVKTKFETLKTNAGTAISNMKTTVSTRFTELSSSVKTTISGLKESASATFSSIASSIKESANTAKEKATKAFSSLATTVKTKFDTVKSSISSVADTIGSKISNAITAKITGAQTAFSNLKSLLSNFNFQFPSIKLPHFKLTTNQVTLLGKTFKYPTGFTVEWYKKAYENPVMFTRPTVLQTPYGAKGFGDGNGGEIVLSEAKLRQIVGGAGDMIVNFTINGSGQNVNAIADAVQRRLVTLQNQRKAAGLA